MLVGRYGFRCKMTRARSARCSSVETFLAGPGPSPDRGVSQTPPREVSQMPEAWKNWENQIVNSRFVLRRFRGASLQSAVFETERPGPPQEKAAIKLIACDPGTKEFDFSRWHAIARLSHPNLLKLYHYGHCRLDGQDLLYVVMELADESLAEILPVRPLSPLEAREMLIPTVDALSFLHAAGFVHARIHPSNILAAGDQIKISSDSLCASKDTVTLRPKPGPYSAPEIAAKGFSSAADIYALGVTLVEALTQRAPSPGAEALPSLPIPFQEIAEKALLPDAALRWTAGDIASRLSGNVRLADARAAIAENAAGQKPSAAAAARQAKHSDATAATKPGHPLSVATPESVPLSPVSPHPPRGPASGPVTGYFKPLLAFAVLIAMGVFAYRTLHHSDGPVDAVAARMGHGESAAPAQSSTERAMPRPAPSTTSAASPKVAPEPARSSVAPTRAPRERSAAGSSHAESAASSKREPQNSALGAKAVSSLSDSTPTAPKPVKDNATPPFAPQASPAELRSPAERPAPAVSSASAVLQQVMPEVSQKALNTIHGSVRLAITVQVDASGKVSSSELSSPSGSSYFNEAALKAASRWQFLPGTESSYVIHFQFTTRGAQATLSHRP